MELLWISACFLVDSSCQHMFTWHTQKHPEKEKERREERRERKRASNCCADVIIKLKAFTHIKCFCCFDIGAREWKDNSSSGGLGLCWCYMAVRIER